MQPPKFAILFAVIVLLAGCAAVINAVDNLSDDQKILKQLEFHTHYDKIARPPPDYNTTNVVLIEFVAQRILNIDEVGQTMSVDGVTQMQWKDRRLGWADKFNGIFGNVTNIFVPRSSLWVPDVITWNTKEHNEYRFNALYAIVMADGSVFTSIPFSSKTLCDIIMQYFPFDSQTCEVIFGSWQMSKEFIELRALDENSSVVVTADNQYINFESDEYCITKKKFKVQPKENAGKFQEAKFTITIQRKPLFYVMNLIVPSFLILAICVFSFFLPPESGERVSLNITLMLALTVFLQIVAASTPAQSDNVPVLTIFFSIVVVLSAVSTIGSMFNIYCYFRGQACQTVDNPVVRLVFLWRLRGGSQRASAGRCKENINIEVESPENENLRAPNGAEAAAAVPDERESVPRIRGTGHPDESEWLTVGRRLDNGLFITMLISTLALGLFIGSVRNPDYVAC